MNDISSCLKLNDARTVRRVVAASIFKHFDSALDGRVKVSHFHFVFRDLVEQKYISSKVVFEEVADQLSSDEDSCVYLNAFIAWMEGSPSSVSSSKKCELFN